MRQYEIRFNNLKHQVFKRKYKVWLFISYGVTKWSSWSKIGEFDTEKEAVEFIKDELNRSKKYRQSPVPHQDVSL